MRTWKVFGLFAIVLQFGVINCDIKTGHGYSFNYDPPEIVINRPGYVYPLPPVPPGQFDEPSTPGNLYGPPPPIYRPPNNTFQDEIPQIIPIPTYLPPPGGGLKPPQFDPIPTDDTIIIPSADYLPLPPSTSYGVPILNSPLQFRIFNMSCLDTQTNRYFRTVVRISQPLEVPPVIDGSSGDCIEGAGDLFRLNLDSNRLTQCGVRYCPEKDKNNLCVTIRMPSVRGLRLPEDPIITLQCRPQETVVSHTKNLRLKTQNIQGRTAATIASGGLQRNFDTLVGLYRRNSATNEFNQPVVSGATVNLGEELLLRATVKDGDGWKYSRMGIVTMHRIPSQRTSFSSSSSPIQQQNSVILIDNAGCRNFAMRAVCPEQPRQTNPLTTTLPFRAFMFQGSNSGDEMVLSVRMLACLHYEDCHQARSCDDKVQTRARIKRGISMRDTTNADKRSNITDWQSYLEFKVVIPEVFQEGKETEMEHLKNVNTYITSVFTVGVLGVVVCAIYLMLKK